MTAPNVRSVSSGTQSSDANEWVLTYPATISAGDLLLIELAADGQRNPGAAGAGFTTLATQKSGTAVTLWTATKVAAGTESGNFSMFLDAGNEQGNWKVTAYKDWFGTVAGGVEVVGTAATGTSTGPDSPDFTPSWDASTIDTTWISLHARDQNSTVTTYPSSYTLYQLGTAGGSAGAGIGTAARELLAASENPGAWLNSASSAWVATTIAIRGVASSPTVKLYANATAAGVNALVNQDDANSPLNSAIDDDPATPDDTDWINNSRHGSPVPWGEAYFPLTDMPVDFSTAVSATIQVRWKALNWYIGGAPTHEVSAQIKDGPTFGSNNLSNEVSLMAVTTDTAFANTGQITLTGIVAGTKSQWDGAHLRLKWGGGI